jgi:hypothetical protein
MNLPAAITAWHREMSLAFHPDRGGSTQAMQALNAGVDRLRQMLGIGA